MVRLNHEAYAIIHAGMQNDTQITAKTAGDNVGVVASPLECSNNANANGMWVKFDVVCEKGIEHPVFYSFQAVLRGRRAMEARRSLAQNRLVFLRGDYVNRHMNVKYFRPLRR